MPKTKIPIANRIICKWHIAQTQTPTYDNNQINESTKAKISTIWYTVSKQNVGLALNVSIDAPINDQMLCQ